jgi:hypothetical protein
MRWGSRRRAERCWIKSRRCELPTGGDEAGTYALTIGREVAVGSTCQCQKWTGRVTTEGYSGQRNEAAVSAVPESKPCALRLSCGHGVVLCGSGARWCISGAALDCTARRRPACSCLLLQRRRETWARRSSWALTARQNGPDETDPPIWAVFENVSRPFILPPPRALSAALCNRHARLAHI